MTVEVRAREDGPRRCGFCREDVARDAAPCDGCGAAYHAECLAELGRCGTRGCPRAVVAPPPPAAAPAPGAVEAAPGEDAAAAREGPPAARGASRLVGVALAVGGGFLLGLVVAALDARACNEVLAPRALLERGACFGLGLLVTLGVAVVGAAPRLVGLEEPARSAPPPLDERASRRRGRDALREERAQRRRERRAAREERARRRREGA